MVDSRHEVLEGFIIALALFIFLFYHVWVFFIAGVGCLRTTKDGYGINGKGRLARVVFSSNVAEQHKHAILGVQISRRGARVGRVGVEGWGTEAREWTD